MSQVPEFAELISKKTAKAYLESYAKLWKQYEERKAMAEVLYGFRRCEVPDSSIKGIFRDLEKQAANQVKAYKLEVKEFLKLSQQAESELNAAVDFAKWRKANRTKLTELGISAYHRFAQRDWTNFMKLTASDSVALILLGGQAKFRPETLVAAIGL